MRKWAWLAAPVLLLMTGAASADDLILVKGRIESSEYMSGLFPMPSGQEPTAEGGDYRVKLAIVDVLIGTPREQALYLTLRMPAQAAKTPDAEIFLFAEQLAGGQLQPIDWDFAENGICIDASVAASYGIEKEIDAAEKKYPCRQ